MISCLHLALTNLDDGRYFSLVGWTFDTRIAHTFPSVDAVKKQAAEHYLKNAAAAMISGFPPKPMGFIWLTEPKSN
jgi:hypothetical protein